MPNFNPAVVVAIFISGPKCWTDRHSVAPPAWLKSNKLPCCSSAFEPHAVFLLSALLSLITHLASLLHLSLLSGAHRQGSITPRPSRGCVLAYQRKKWEEKKQSNNLNHGRHVLWHLYPTDTTQHEAFFHRMSPNKLCQVQKARSPWKNNTFYKDLPLPG